MTLYATRADLDKKPWGKDIQSLADLDGDGIEDDGLVDALLASASAEVESKVAGRADLGLAPPFPTRLVDATCDIFRYLLYVDVPPEHVRDRYNEARRLLVAVRDGLESFGLASGGAAVESSMQVEIQHQGSVFGREGGAAR